ncbi:porin family protein [Roseivirga sp. BDSF3-8]|uniref:type IX secretion/gliding motility protein PorT/SprT n=1 Tax=Roseivirga sp. BDSF3-8 TaxID=3241598 RepID=UPI003531AEAF
MDTTYFRHKLDLHGKKIVLAALLATLLIPFESNAQITREKYNPNYDERPIRYGFLLGVQRASLQPRYDENFVTEDFDTTYAIQAPWSTGLVIGFIGQLRLNQYLDLRLTPMVTIAEYDLEYTYAKKKDEIATAETVFVNLPLMLKYKSYRRGNYRMYITGGANPSFEVSGRKEDEGDVQRLPIQDMNFALELGLGLDIYYPLFKFSPEIRFSRGIVNMKKDSRENLTEGLDRITTNTVSLLFHFQ